MTSRGVPAGRVIPSPSGPTSMWAPMRGAFEQGAGPIGLGALDLERERGSRQQLGDRSLADDVAPVHDGDGVTGPLDLVEQVRGEHDGAALGHEREDHVAHLVHAGRVEPVHRLVQDQQLRDPRAGRRRLRGAGACPSSTSTPGRWRDAACRRAPVTARCGPGPPARVPRRGARGSASRSDGRGTGARRRWRRPVRAPRRVLGHRVSEQGHRARVGVGQSEQHADERRLAGAVRTEVAERPRGTSSSTPFTATFSPNRLVSPWVSTAHWLSAA